MRPTGPRWFAHVLLATALTGCAEHGERVDPAGRVRDEAKSESGPGHVSPIVSSCASEHPSLAANPAMVGLVGQCLRSLDDLDRCSPTHLLSADAAVCIAWAEGARRGISTPEVTAFANPRGLFWRISVTTHQGPSSRGGESWTVDARTGALTPGLGWGETWD